MKKIITLLILIWCLTFIPSNNIKAANTITNRLKGRLLLQVEQGGAIWYVNPVDSQKYRVTFANVLNLFQNFALGITNADLIKIPANLESIKADLDSDGDGYKDKTELEHYYSPYIPASYKDKGKFTIDKNLANRLKGRLLLQVEQGGAIWYVNHIGIRYRVRWDNLMSLFRQLALGITNNDLSQIATGNIPNPQPVSNPPSTHYPSTNPIVPPVADVKFLSDDSTTQQLLSGQISQYDMREFDYPAKLDGPYRIDNYAYKIVSVIKMLGYRQTSANMPSGAGVYFSVLQLNKFQKQHNLPQSHFLTAQTLSKLRDEYAKIEALYYHGRSFPLYNDFVTTPETEIPKEHYLTIVSLALQALPQHLVVWSKENFTDPQLMIYYDESRKTYCEPNYYNTFKKPRCCPTVCELYYPDGKLINGLPAVDDRLAVATYLHEYAHYLDSRLYPVKVNTSKGIIDTTITDFTQISWTEDQSKQKRSYDELQGLNKYEYISDYSQNNQYEDFAEHFQTYVMNGKLFRKAARYNSFLQQKYDWLKNNVFLGIEYNTGGFSSGVETNSLNIQPNGYASDLDFDYVWDRQFPRL